MESYEERRAKERKEEQEKQRRFEKILKLLGCEVEPKDFDKEFYRSTAWGTWKQEGSINISQAWNKPNHLQVGGSYPTDKDGNSHTYGIDYKNINISLSKSDEKIVEEIKKRFLPEYEENLWKVVKANTEANIKKHTRENTIKEFAEALGTTVSPNNYKGDYGTASLYTYESNIRSVDIKTNYAGEQADIELKGVDKETALKIAKFIKEVRK